jgi:hypothetical protein
MVHNETNYLNEQKVLRMSCDNYFWFAEIRKLVTLKLRKIDFFPLHIKAAQYISRPECNKQLWKQNYMYNHSKSYKQLWINHHDEGGGDGSGSSFCPWLSHICYVKKVMMPIIFSHSNDANIIDYRLYLHDYIICTSTEHSQNGIPHSEH